jgi:hypothetical protein
LAGFSLTAVTVPVEAGSAGETEVFNVHPQSSQFRANAASAVLQLGQRFDIGCDLKTRNGKPVHYQPMVIHRQTKLILDQTKM